MANAIEQVGTLIVGHAFFGLWGGALISDEIGFSWAHYFQQRAEQCLGTIIPEQEEHKRPLIKNGWKYHFFKQWALRKLHATIPQIFVTAALMTIVLFILHGRIKP